MGHMLKVGQRAPSLEANDQNGQPVSLEALLRNGPLVLYFYPKDNTPVCTREACHFRDAHAELADRGAQVVGVSADSDRSHRAFAEEHSLPFPLISDPDRRLAKQWDATHPFGLGTARVTYVVGEDGTLRGAFHHELRAKKHVEEVLGLIGRPG